jgi:hypothetical protein
MGLRLSEAKTRVCHIDEGFDFLGFRIQRRTKRGTHKRVVYTYPSKKSLGTVIAKVRTLTMRSSNPTLPVLLNRLNPVLRGWCNYFRHGVSSATSTPTPGGESLDGSAYGTTVSLGRCSADATSMGGGRWRTGCNCSTPGR